MATEACGLLSHLIVWNDQTGVSLIVAFVALRERILLSLGPHYILSSRAVFPAIVSQGRVRAPP